MDVDMKQYNENSDTYTRACYIMINNVHDTVYFTVLFHKQYLIIFYLIFTLLVLFLPVY